MIYSAATTVAQITDQLLRDTFGLAKANPIGIGAGRLRQRMSKRPTDGDRLTAHLRVSHTLPVVFPLRHHHAQEDNIRPLPIAGRFLPRRCDRPGEEKSPAADKPRW